MIFDPKIIVTLVFCIVSLAIIFVVKNRTTIIAATIISHLFALLLVAMSIVNYGNFKEISISLIAYSMALLFVVSSHEFPEIDVADEKRNWRLMTRRFSLFCGGLMIFLIVFSMVKKVPEISSKVAEKKLERQNEIMMNPMILPSHPVHLTIRKFYLGKKFEHNSDDWSDKIQAKSELNEKRQARLKTKLASNFLLKRSSDVILIICAITAGLLLISVHKNQHKDNK